MESPHLVRPIDYFLQQDGIYFQMLYEGLLDEFAQPSLLDDIVYVEENKTMCNTLLQLDTICHYLDRPLNSQMLEEICFMVLFTLAQLQERHGFMHLDLKATNILISVEKDSSIRWLHYVIQGKDYFLPYRGFHTRLCDFGCSCVFHLYGTDRVILPSDYDKGVGETINFHGKWQPGYDMHFFLPQLWHLADQWKMETPDLIKEAISRWSLAINPTTHRPKDPICSLTALEMLEDLRWTTHRPQGNDLAVCHMGQVDRRPPDLSTRANQTTEVQGKPPKRSLVAIPP